MDLRGPTSKGGKGKGKWGGNGECERSERVTWEVRGMEKRRTSCTKNYFRPRIRLKTTKWY